MHLVMEYADGGTLEDILNKRRPTKDYLSEDEILRLFAMCCLALDFAHALDLIHRDIKPCNFLMTKNGIVKLADFGVSAIGGNGKTQCGTYYYMAPEVMDADESNQYS